MCSSNMQSFIRKLCSNFLDQDLLSSLYFFPEVFFVCLLVYFVLFCLFGLCFILLLGRSFLLLFLFFFLFGSGHGGVFLEFIS